MVSGDPSGQDTKVVLPATLATLLLTTAVRGSLGVLLNTLGILYT